MAARIQNPTHIERQGGRPNTVTLRDIPSVRRRITGGSYCRAVLGQTPKGRPRKTFRRWDQEAGVGEAVEPPVVIRQMACNRTECPELGDEERDPVCEGANIHGDGDAEKHPSIAFRATAAVEYRQQRGTIE